MANEVLVGLKIGAAISSTLSAAFGSARSTVQQLGRATDSLTARQRQLGTELSAALARGGTGIERMRRQYDQVGRTIDQLRLKQERLTASIARGETLKAQRADLRGEFKETAGTALAFGAPIVQALRTGISFQDEVRDIRITAGFDAAEEAELAKMIRGVALDKNQAQSDVNLGVGTLVAGGLDDLKALKEYTPVMAEVATATRAGMEDLANTTIALRDHLKITATDYKATMNMLVAGGKAGQFELPDMAKHLPGLASQYGNMGQTGKGAVAELTAALQVTRMGAGNSDEAANNLRNLLSKLTSPDTIKSFKDAGIDLKDSMEQQASKGMTPLKSMLATISTYLGSAGPSAAKKYRSALEIKDDQEREMALQRLDEAYKLGELFRDQQVMAALRPLLANRDKLAEIESGSQNAADQDVVGADFALRMDTAGSSVKAFRIGLSELSISLSDALLPAVNDLLKDIIPVVHRFSEWTGENPKLVKGIVGLVGGLLAGKLAFIGLKYGINLVLSPITSVATTLTSLSARWTMLRAMWQAGRFAPFVIGLSRVGAGLLSVLRFSGLFLRGVGMAFGAPVMLAGRGLLTLAGILGGSLVTGLRLAGHAVLWLGRALMLNPIGLAITAIAGAAYLIYRYWEPIKGFFSGLWNELKSDAGNGITGILSIVANFSPLGLFYRGFAGVMNYFGVEMPARFSEFGGMLIQGLVSGIRRAAGAVKDVILSIGGSIKEWFAGTLGIHSPSRVFIGYGQNIGEGAALGIAGSRGLVRDAAMGLAGASDVRLSAPSLAPVAGSGRGMAPPNMAAVSAASALAGAAAGDVTFNYNPVIHLPGGGPEAGAQLQAGLRMSFAEFERHMREFMRQEQRLSFSGGRS